MNLKKAEARFKRAWAKATAGKTVPHVRVLPVAEAALADQTTADFVLQFDAFATLAIEEYVVKTGCASMGCIGASVLVKAPADWISAPSRLLLPETAADRLHNALLDAGVADWIDIRTASDGVNLEAELLDTLTLGQLAALKVGYDIPLHDLSKPIYTFAERNSAVEASASVPDAKTVETRVRQCWAGAHGGKIAKVEATDDPRLFFVEHVKPIPAMVNFLHHGLEWHAVTPTRSSVRVNDDLWGKIVAKFKMQQVAPPVDMSGEYVVERTVEQRAEPSAEPSAPVESDDAEITRLRIELARAEDRIAALQEAIRAFTPAVTEWQTLRLPIKIEGSDTVPHERIAEEEAKGWTVHSTQYVATGGFTLLVLMKREPSAPAIQPPKRVSVSTWSSNGHGELVFPVNGSGLYEQMIAEMDAELAGTATDLLNSLRRVGVMNG